MDKEEKNRRKLSIAMLCIGFLHMSDFVSDSENEKIYSRIRDFQEKEHVNISSEQLESADFLYDDCPDIENA